MLSWLPQTLRSAPLWSQNPEVQRCQISEPPFLFYEIQTRREPNGRPNQDEGDPFQPSETVPGKRSGSAAAEAPPPLSSHLRVEGADGAGARREGGPAPFRRIREGSFGEDFGSNPGHRLKTDLRPDLKDPL